MSVFNWVNASTSSNRIYEQFQGRVENGSATGAVEFIPGLEGFSALIPRGDGVVIDVPRGDMRTGYPITASVWFMVPVEGQWETTTLVAWGSTPGINMTVYGYGSGYPSGSVGFSVRMSNGQYAVSTRSVPVERGVWHLATVTVQQVTIWGGAEAVAYVDGVRVGGGRYNGGLLNIVNLDRPGTIVIGEGGPVVVDEFITHKDWLTPNAVGGLWNAVDDKTGGALAGTQSGWGVVF